MRTTRRSAGTLQRALLGSCLAGGLLAACLTPGEAVLDADREVYEIIRGRRDELAGGEPFQPLNIDRDADTLRRRLLDGQVSTGPLELFACLEAAAENSRDFQTRRESLYLAALDLTLERWDLSVQENGSFGAFLSRRGAADDAGLLSNLGFTRLLASGMQVAGGIGLDLVRDIGRGDGWDALSNLSLSISQPILRGFGRAIVLEPLTQAERNVMYEARAYERFRATFAFDVASSFFRILQQVAVLENERQNERGLSVLRERNEAFAEAGLLNEIQVDQARQNELAARNRVIVAQRSLQGQLDEFKLFLGLPITVDMELDAGDLLRIDAWSALALELNEATVIEVALARRLDHATVLDRVVDAERKVRVSADALRAGLELNIDMNAASPEGRPGQFRQAGVNTTVGLTFDAPFERLPERNAYRERLIQLKAARRAAEQSADSIRTDLRDSLRRLRAARQTHVIQTRAVVLAERRVESAQLNLEAGRASTRDVLEAQEDLVGARNAATGALTEYILSGLALFRDMELLNVEEDRIEMDAAPLSQPESGPEPQVEDQPETQPEPQMESRP